MIEGKEKVEGDEKVEGGGEATRLANGGGER